MTTAAPICGLCWFRDCLNDRTAEDFPKDQRALVKDALAHIHGGEGLGASAVTDE